MSNGQEENFLSSSSKASSVNRRVELYDTTLRDGTQGFGFTLSLEDKLTILRELDVMGLDYIEGGYPLANPKDIAFFQEAQSIRLEKSRLAAFGMTRRKGRSVEDDPGMEALIAAGTTVVAVVGKTWDFHVREVLRVSLDENLRMINDTVKYFHKRGKEVIYDAEHFFDGYKSDPAYAIKTLCAALDAGTDLLCLCDTNGGSLPREVATIVTEVNCSIPGARFGIHPHNDCGLAVANALEAVLQGAVQVQGTINGVGERCGNVDLIVVAANLGLKTHYELMEGRASISKLTKLSRFVDKVASREPVASQPYVGIAAFAHKGGMHAHAVLRNMATYEHVPPECVGNERRILISELSGISNIRERVSRILGDCSLKRETLRAILGSVNRLEKEGYAYEAADASFELLVWKQLGLNYRYFRIRNYQCKVSQVEANFPVTNGSVSVEINGEIRRGTSQGEAPLSVLEGALRGALADRFPTLDDVRVLDPKFRTVERLGYCTTRVRAMTDFTDGQSHWSTVAVGRNFIEAGLNSLVEGFEYHLLQVERSHTGRRVGA